MNVTRWIELYKRLQTKKWWIPSVLIAFSLIVALLVDTRGKEAPVKDGSLADISGIDTYIPNGFVLLPIEIQNQASLESILGQYGVVDLYSPGDASPVAKSVKIVRSPKNPEQFSILVPEGQSGPLVKASTRPFFVIIQNPESKNAQYRAPLKKSRIVIDN
jgi:hypothetical protein